MGGKGGGRILIQTESVYYTDKRTLSVHRDDLTLHGQKKIIYLHIHLAVQVFVFFMRAVVKKREVVLSTFVIRNEKMGTIISLAWRNSQCFHFGFSVFYS